jgi:sensor histidine kinase YesM|tara:strand:+ start:336 stop:593 length:258 start_codon:yes stop_codon:yes gene_type:complete
MTKEEQKNFILLLATFKSFQEQLYNLKGAHAQKVKMYFNRLLKVANQYENEIQKQQNAINDKAVEDVYDSLTDIIYTLREGVPNE